MFLIWENPVNPHLFYSGVILHVVDSTERYKEPLLTLRDRCVDGCFPYLTRGNNIVSNISEPYKPKPSVFFFYITKIRNFLLLCQVFLWFFFGVFWNTEFHNLLLTKPLINQSHYKYMYFILICQIPIKNFFKFFFFITKHVNVI